MKHIIYRNNIDYPYKAIVIKAEDIDLTDIKSGLLVYYDTKQKKYKLARNNKCDITTGGIYAGELKE